MLERFLTHGSWPPDVGICVAGPWAQWLLVWVWGWDGGNHNAKDKRPADLSLCLDFGVVSSSGFEAVKAIMVFTLCCPDGVWKLLTIFYFNLRIERSPGIRVHLARQRNAFKLLAPGSEFIGPTSARATPRPTHPLSFSVCGRNGAIINSFRHLFDISTRRNLIALACVFVCLMICTKAGQTLTLFGAAGRESVENNGRPTGQI